jgi:hypothetical protein
MNPGQPAKTVLIFPYDGPAAEAEATLFRQLGLKVVCAHSEARGAGMLELPYVTAPDFAARFAQLLTEHGVTHVMSPHPVVWSAMASMIASGGVSLTLLEPSPYQRDLASYVPAWEWAASWSPLVPPKACVAHGDDVPTALAALHAGYFAIPGQSDLAKLESLLSVMSSCPVGDIVEIGSLFGRSAFALAYLARLFGTGNVLCVDPWALQYGQDQGKSAQLVNSAAHRRDFELVHRAFRTNRLMYGLDNLDWQRKPSLEAARDYVRGTALTRADSAGSIALLHIDGNHALDAVRDDIRVWSSAVMPGGWVVVDDYRWAFGTGPQQAGDEFLAEHGSGIDLAYCAGDTLYVRLAG